MSIAKISGDSIFIGADTKVFNTSRNADGKIDTTDGGRQSKLLLLHRMVVIDKPFMIRGYYETIKTLYKEEQIWRNGTEAGIIKLITVESEANKIAVGPPIEVILLQKNKGIWLKKSEFSN